LTVVFAVGSLAFVEGFRGRAALDADQSGCIEGALELAVVSLGAMKVADASTGVATASGGEELCAEEVADADHAADDLRVAVTVEALGDELVQHGELPVEGDDGSGQLGNQFASHRFAEDSDLLGLSGMHGRFRSTVDTLTVQR
jgi:hypothetical protein